MGFDAGIYDYVSRELQIPALKMAGRFAAALAAGDQLASFCILFIMAGYFWQKPRLVKISVGGLFALAASGIVVQILKYLIGRARPARDLGDLAFIGPHFSPGGYDSFPSGHTTSLFSLLAFFCRYYPGWTIPLYGAGLLLSILGRVITEQHFFSDVIGGAIVGSAVGIILAGRFRRAVEASRPPEGAATAEGPADQATNVADAGLYAAGRSGVSKELAVVVLFSSATLLIGLRAEFFSHIQSAFFGVLTVLAVYFLARRLCGKGTAPYAALILSSSLLFVSVCRLLPADAAWLFLTVLAFLSYGYSAQAGSTSNLLLVMCYASLGLGFLAKGPVALVPAAVFFLYEYIESRHLAGSLARSALRHGVLLAFTLLVFALWLGADAPARRPVSGFFFNDIIARTGLTRHAGRVIYYLPLLVTALFPWTFFLIACFVQEGKRWSRETAIDSNSLLLFLWAAVVLGLFPFIAAKSPHYIVLALPPLACLLGRFIQRELAQSAAALRFSLLATLVVAGCFVVVPVILYPARPQYSSLKLAAPFAVLAIFLAAGWLSRHKRPWTAFFATMCFGALGFYVSAITIALQK